MKEDADSIRRARLARGSASIQDVADLAAVSIATVSRAVNKPHLVSPETARRVQTAIDQLGYRPNRFAQGLMTRRSGLLGIALPDIHGEFYSELLRGADAEARRLGYQVLVSAFPSHPEPGTSPGGGLGRALGLVDGLALMITEPDERLLGSMLRLQIPLVVLDADTPGGFDAVLVDHSSGALAAAHHLTAYTPAAKCFFVGGPESNLDTQTRRRAFERALSERNHSPRPDQIQYHEYSIAWGESWARKHFSTHSERGIAVFAANDDIAYGVLRASLELGLRSPQDIRIVGFDGSTLSAVVRPALSTVRIPRDEVGRLAVRALVGRIEDPDSPPNRITLPTELIIRASSDLNAAGQ